ncbi:MAG: Crp/Fnr family transcriptional regulator [Bacteroidetes bacterium GWE2_41_25]|nr:MAG: Crp/Fnr family transcriptional regulator [Bacteroidetes bacterium GWA2_40_15]OFX82739.1 MAG: Crp/Fnr family transcriptional regulator [Bacteroidetes bacterium GWC2_40_22]OFY05468.1 MAG: Crp/Fnr family transcriptional regulator [Bacteroidetes bacterium GWE2_41_25]OFY58848.1 MAG: Crp/Fnr family transcriptional regulator [Bacteroidetes bacterium GWF2_41_9]HBH84024.1 Crp/Fnr family transcriptional regulator [Bacteroidales bacterium]
MKQQENQIPLCAKCSFESEGIFKNLTSEETDVLNFEKDFRQYKRGDILYQEGNRISGFFCINGGIIKVFKTGLDGKEQIIKFARRGDIIAYRSVLSNELACTSAKVIEDCQVCFIPSEILISFIKTNSTFALDLIRLACHELGEANSFITDIAQKTVRERLAEVLLLLVNDFGLDNDKYLKIALTREELANIVGTATESVIRLLSEFKSDKLVELNGRKIKILNSKGLEKISNVYN